MSDETTLLPCPFCGGEASLKVLEYGDGCKVWGVFCESDLASKYSHGHFIDNYATEAEAIAAWNNRATHGTLTAEQVRECVQVVYFEGYSDGSVNRGRHLEETDWQAIADELNARAERTCECVSEYVESPFDGKTIVLHRCSECHKLMRPHMLYCPNCGAKVRNE